MNTLDIVCDFSGRLSNAGIEHVIGGSVASSVWGEPRQTNDADIEVWVNRSNSSKFIEACAKPYHVSIQELSAELESREQHRVVQVMQTVEVFKIDCFIVSDEFAHEGLRRAKKIAIGDCQLPMAPAEYILLRKLTWFELGRRVSDRQWNDIRALIEVQADELDVDWLRQWAADQGVAELLEVALTQSGPKPSVQE